MLEERVETLEAASPLVPEANEVNAVMEEIVETPPVEVNAVEDRAEEGVNRHAAAGREGARRRQELIELGKLYEQEHGLKRGRQRIRQLIEQGKLYEQEHGLRPRRIRKRGPRLSDKQLLTKLLEGLARIARSPYRAHIEQLARALENEA
jgi:hypothetical protein